MTVLEEMLLKAVRGMLGDSHDGTSYCCWCARDFERKDVDGNFCEYEDCPANLAREAISLSESQKLCEMILGDDKV